MEVALIILGVFVLYLRTWTGKNRHYYIIDDNVRRWDYLYVVPETSPPPTFYSSKPHPWRHFFLVLIHCLNVFVINLLFGWQVALLFAFHPLSVNGTAWITGGYYAVTAFLSLTGFFFLTNFPNLFGAIISSLFFTAALGSTITCIGMPLFIWFFNPWGLVWFWPLATYVFGKRFTAGFAIRNAGKKDNITWRKPAVMTKVIAYYIKLALFPSKLGFFRSFGFYYGKHTDAKKEMDSYNKDFLVALATVGCFTYIGWQFSPLGTLWFLFNIAPFSQFKLLGQFVAERYLYLPNIGICLILASMLGAYPILFTVLATLYIYRSHLYIPSFQCIENLYKNGIKNFPECISNYCNLGERMLHTGETLRSYRLLFKALEMDGDSFLAHTNLAAYWIGVKNFDKAIYHTKNALASEGHADLAEKVLGGQQKQLEKIVANLKKESEKTEWEIDESTLGIGNDAPKEEALAGHG